MLVKWNPFYEMNTLQKEINKLFTSAQEGGGEASSLEKRGWVPEVDICENEHDIRVMVAIPGMEQKDIDVSLEDNQLVIKGEKKLEKEDKGKNYIRREISYGSFYRAFTVSTHVKENEIKANYKSGVLEIILPKEEKAKPKKIEIK